MVRKFSFRQQEWGKKAKPTSAKKLLVRRKAEVTYPKQHSGDVVANSVPREHSFRSNEMQV